MDEGLGVKNCVSFTSSAQNFNVEKRLKSVINRRKSVCYTPRCPDPTTVGFSTLTKFIESKYGEILRILERRDMTLEKYAYSFESFMELAAASNHDWMRDQQGVYSSL